MPIATVISACHPERSRIFGEKSVSDLSQKREQSERDLRTLFAVFLNQSYFPYNTKYSKTSLEILLRLRLALFDRLILRLTKSSTPLRMTRWNKVNYMPTFSAGTISRTHTSVSTKIPRRRKNLRRRGAAFRNLSTTRPTVKITICICQIHCCSCSIRQICRGN